MLSVHVHSDQLTAKLNAIVRQGTRPRPILDASARGARKVLLEHFRQRDQTPNRLGGRRTHWWASVARSTQLASVTDTEAIVSIGEPGLALKVRGGRVVPKRARMLTIPIHPAAHGRRAGTLAMTGNRLWVFRPRGKEGPAFLAQSTGDDQFRLLYVLKAFVDMPADPQAMPEQNRIEQEILRRAEAQLAMQIRQTG